MLALGTVADRLVHGHYCGAREVAWWLACHVVTVNGERVTDARRIVYEGDAVEIWP